MAKIPDPILADMQHISDTSADVYEAIATLEFAGKRASFGAVSAATGLADAVLAECLTALVGLCLLRERDDGEGLVYFPACRGWSARPEQPVGKRLT